MDRHHVSFLYLSFSPIRKPGNYGAAQKDLSTKRLTMPLGTPCYTLAGGMLPGGAENGWLGSVRPLAISASHRAVFA